MPDSRSIQAMVDLTLLWKCPSSLISASSDLLSFSSTSPLAIFCKHLCKEKRAAGVTDVPTQASRLVLDQIESCAFRVPSWINGGTAGLNRLDICALTIFRLGPVASEPP